MVITLLLFLFLGFLVYTGIMFWIGSKYSMSTNPPVFFMIENQYKLGIILLLCSNIVFLVYSLSNNTRVNIGRFALLLGVAALGTVLYKVFLDWWSEPVEEKDWYEK